MKVLHEVQLLVTLKLNDRFDKEFMRGTSPLVDLVAGRVHSMDGCEGVEAVLCTQNEGIKQILHALERQAQALDVQSMKLANELNYDAQFSEDDAQRMREAIQFIQLASLKLAPWPTLEELGGSTPAPLPS